MYEKEMGGAITLGQFLHGSIQSVEFVILGIWKLWGISELCDNTTEDMVMKELYKTCFHIM